MPYKKQHYVPQVYLEPWKSLVKPNEPNKPRFGGVYVFHKENPYHPFDTRSIESILVKSRVYTMFLEQHGYAAFNCPEIVDDFINQIQEVFSRRGVVAKYKELFLSSKSLLREYYRQAAEWVYYYLADGSIASQKRIYNEIKNLSSDIIENAFSTYVEKDWPSIRETFLRPTDVITYGRMNHKYDDAQSVMKVVEMLFYTLCRNPNFDFFEIFPWVKSELVDPLFHDLGFDEATRESIYEITKYGLWISEIYKSLHGIKKGVFGSFIELYKRMAQVTLYKIPNQEEGCFITSDNPVVIHNSYVERGNYDGIYYPLTPEFLIVIGSGKFSTADTVQFRIVRNNDIRKINNIIMAGAEDTIVSNRRTLAEII